MSSSFSGSTAQGRHFAAWSLVSWFFLLKEHGIMVVGFNILGLWSHKKSRQIGSWGHTDMGMSGWVGEVFDPCSQDLHCLFYLMNVWNPTSGRQVQSILPSLRADLWHQIMSELELGSHQFSSWSCISLMSACSVAPVHCSEHYSANRQMD